MINTSIYNDGGSGKKNHGGGGRKLEHGGGGRPMGQGGNAPSTARYYKRPEFNRDAERLAQEVDRIKPQFDQMQDNARKQRSAALELRTKAEAYKKKLDLLDGRMTSDTGKQMYADLQQEYLGTYSKSQIAQFQSQRADTELEPIRREYERRSAAFDSYINQQQAEYDKWKSTIREPEIVRAEIDGVDAQLNKLTRQRTGLQNMNMQMASSIGYTGSIAAWNNADPQKQIDSNMAQLQQLNWQIAQLTKSKALLDEEAQWGEYYRYADLRENPDFAQMSQYNEQFVNQGNPDTLLYQHINTAKTPQHQLAADYAPMKANDIDRFERITDEEAALYNYIYATQGADKAKGYINYLKTDLNKRQRDIREAQARKFAQEHPVKASVKSLLESPMRGAGRIGQAVDFLDEGKMDPNASYNHYSFTNSAMRDQVSQNIRNSGKWGEVGSYTYMLGMSMGDFLINAGIGAGVGAAAGAPALGMVLTRGIMGSGAAADTTIQAKDRGLSDRQAFILGTIAGLAEVITEKVSLDALLDADLAKDTLKRYIAKNMIAEGSEEAASDIINLFADIFVSQDQSQWRQSIEHYKQLGATETEAFSKAFGEQALSVGADFLGGAISGGIMSGVNGGRLELSKAYHRIMDNRTQAKTQVQAQEDLFQDDDTDLDPEDHTADEPMGNQIQRLFEKGSQGNDENINNPVAQEAEPEGLSLPRIDAEQAQSASQNQMGSRPEEPQGLRLGQVYEEEQARRAELIPGIPMNPELQTVQQTARPAEQGRIDLNQSISAAEQIRQEGANHGNVAAAETRQTAGNALYDEGQERTYGTSSREQTGTVEVLSGASRGKPDAHAQGSADRRYLKRNLRKAGIQQVSSKELGVASGTEMRNVMVVPSQMWDADIREAAQIVRNDVGMEPVFVSGVIRVKGSDGRESGVRGIYAGNQIIIQADNKHLSPQQIADHEVYHQKANMAPSLNREIQEAILSKYSREAFMEVLNQYIEALAGVYGSGQEAMRKIAEEVFADAYAGINAFGAQADRFSDTVNNRMEELWIGKSRNSQDNGVKQTRGPNRQEHAISRDAADSAIRYSVEDDDSGGKEWDFDAAEAKAEAQSRETKNFILQQELGQEGYREYQKQKKVRADQEEKQRKEENSRRAQQRRQEKIQKNAEKTQRWEQQRAEKRAKLESEVKPTQAKRSFRNNVTALFSIPAGKKKEVGSILDSFADRVARKEYIGQGDRDALFDRLYREGVMTVSAGTVYQMGRDYVAKGRIYVPDRIRKEFGDDWGTFQRRAFNNQIYLTSDRSAAGIDQWNMELADMLPVLFDSEETDLRMALEQIVDVAEEGKAEKMSLPEYTAMLAHREHISENRLLDDLERNLDNAIMAFANDANLEVKLRTSLIDKQMQIEQKSFSQLQKEAEARQRRREMAERQRAQKELKELQDKTLKALQWLKKNRNRAPEELRETWNEVLGDIDLYAAGAANEMNWSDKYQATWKDLAQMYKDAQKEDPNFFPSQELERIVHRLDDAKIADLDLDALQDLYKAAVGLRTEYYNRKNVVLDQENRIFEEVYEDSKNDIQNAPGKFTGTELDKLFNRDQLTPMNVLQRMVGWNPDSSFYAMAKQLENGERSTRAYTVKAERMLENFLREHEDWVKKADGQGKDAIWYEITVPEVTKLGFGHKPIFGKNVTVSMTPAQKVHMYLESKNIDNLRHMAGGRTFVDQKLYSKGERKEAFAQGTTVRLAPETVKSIVQSLTPEEMELAKILENYYNSFAKKEINKVSNILYGFDKALGDWYAPIYTNENYNKAEPGVYNVTAEGVGNMKGRIPYSKNPSYNLSAFDAFERHVDQTARFVGMSIPIRNWNTLMNWRESNNSMMDVITHKWGKQAREYIEKIVTRLQDGSDVDSDVVSGAVSKLQSNYISAVFGLNPSIVLKQLGSVPMAAGYLGSGNFPTPLQIKGIDKDLISKYTQDLEWRTLGYSMPETKQLKDNPNWTQSNKVFQFWFGGGAITAMDGWAASVLWPWAENKVRAEYPELQIGTEEQIDAGESPFYKKVAEEFDDAVARSQSVADEIHQSNLRKSKNPIAKAFTLFRSDTAQTYNALRQKIGEAQYYERNGMQKQAREARKAVGAVVGAMLINNIWSAAITMLMALWKHKDKRYRDEEGNLTAGSVLQEVLDDMTGSVAGVVVGGEELYELIGNIVTGDRWYGIDTPGMEQLNDALDAIRAAGGGIKDFVYESVNIIGNGGNFGKYLYQKRNDILGGIKNVAATAATYFGLPVNNLEAYLMGTVKTIFPELGTKYEDLIEAPAKEDLSGLSGKSLRSRMQDILKNRGIRLDTETVNALAEQYEAGNRSAFPSNIPTSVSVNGEDRKLSAVQQQTYGVVWGRIAGNAIADIVRSDQYRNADADEQKRIINRLYDYAAANAKAALFDDYELSGTAKENGKITAAGVNLAELILWESKTVDMKSGEKAAVLAEWQIPEQAKRMVFQYKVSDSNEEKINDLIKTGVSFNRFLDIYSKYFEIRNTDAKAGEKAIEFAKWLDGQSLNKNQKVAIKESLKFFAMMPMNAGKYDKLVEAGVDSNDAYTLTKDLEALEPQDGKATVSDVQKWRLSVDFSDDIKDQIAALSLVMSERQFMNVEVARDMGVSPRNYVTLQEIKVRFDADGNGSYKQSEIQAAIDSMKLSQEEGAVLWQLANGSSDPKNNPYNTSIGQKVKDAIEKKKEEPKSTSFSDEIMRQLTSNR